METIHSHGYSRSFDDRFMRVRIEFLSLQLRYLLYSFLLHDPRFHTLRLHAFLSLHIDGHLRAEISSDYQKRGDLFSARVWQKSHYASRLCNACHGNHLAWVPFRSPRRDLHFHVSFLRMRIYGNVCRMAENQKSYDRALLQKRRN